MLDIEGELLKELTEAINEWMNGDSGQDSGL